MRWPQFRKGSGASTTNGRTTRQWPLTIFSEWVLTFNEVMVNKIRAFKAGPGRRHVIRGDGEIVEIKTGGAS
jgi:hypothetical protein